MEKQQQQQESLKPKLTIKTKGMVFSEINEFLANKKKECAGRVAISENKT